MAASWIGHDHLDAAIEVALHQVGAADVDLFLAAVEEVVDARVLEEAADDRSHRDVVADAGNAWPQAAHAADDQVDLHAGLRRAEERLDHALVGDGVVLDDDARRPAGLRVLDLAIDRAP